LATSVVKGVFPDGEPDRKQSHDTLIQWFGEPNVSLFAESAKATQQVGQATGFSTCEYACVRDKHHLRVFSSCTASPGDQSSEVGINDSPDPNQV
jgi:hypothetical protein